MPRSADRVLTLTRREIWAYRLAFACMAIFTVLGFFVLFSPSDRLIAAYSAMLMVTLTSGVASGLVTMYV